MEKSKLYTSTGDQGMTSLVNGTRVPKDCVRLEAYGTIDEFSSFIGVVSSSPSCPEKTKGQLMEIQLMLFDLGGYLACEVKPGETPEAWRLCQTDIEIVEGWIDELDNATPKVNAFILPGGSEIAAATHVARAVCRRAERRIFTLAATEYVDPLVMTYFNRLSDYLFILARNLNYCSGCEEITWHKR